MARWSPGGVLCVVLLSGAIEVGWAADRSHRPVRPRPGAEGPYILLPYGFGLPLPDAAGPMELPVGPAAPREPGIPAAPGEPGIPGAPGEPGIQPAPWGPGTRFDPGWGGRFLAPLTEDRSDYSVVPPGPSRTRPGPGGGYYVVPKR